MDIDTNEAYNDTIANAEHELIEAVRKYSKAFFQSSYKNGGVPTINQIEDIWNELDAETRNIFVKLVSGSIFTHMSKTTKTAWTIRHIYGAV